MSGREPKTSPISRIRRQSSRLFVLAFKTLVLLPPRTGFRHSEGSHLVCLGQEDPGVDTREVYTHEYRKVHADMVRGTPEPQPVRRYVQVSNSGTTTVKGTEHVPWDYVTCLTMPSLFVVHMGFQNPGYRATAGAHIFCRLDQEGCLAEQVAQFSRGQATDDSDIGKVQCLLFHKRSDPRDEYSEAWFTKRAAHWEDVANSDERLRTYTLWRDVTPKDIDYFFHDTQFSSGSWLGYKAVEAFRFTDDATAAAFMEQHGPALAADSAGARQAVVGVPDIIVSRL